MKKFFSLIVFVLGFFTLGFATNAFAYTPKLSSGFDHACALTSQGLVCWGDPSATSVPASISSIPPNSVMALGSGSYHTCVVDSGASGAVRCFGSTVNGAVMTPQVAQTNVVQLALGWGHTCTLNSSNAVYCWGFNDFGQATVPASIVASGATAIYAGPGAKHTCAKTPTNSLVCWGNNAFGQTSVPASLTGIVSTVALGSANTCVLTTTGGKVCFGWNQYGQNDPPKGSFTTLSAGRAHLCSIIRRPAHLVACWGENSMGQATPPVSFANPQVVALGFKHTCVLSNPSLGVWGVDCWGDPTLGIQSVPPLVF